MCPYVTMKLRNMKSCYNIGGMRVEVMGDLKNLWTLQA